MAANATTIKLSGLARMLVQEKLLSETEANLAQAQANTARVPFITQIIAGKRITAEKIAEVSSQAFGFPYFNLDAFNPDYLPAKSIDVKLMQTNRVIALQNRNNVLFVGISDPTNLHSLDSVQFQMGMTLSPVVVEDDKLGRWIDKIVESKDTSMKSLDMDGDFDLDMGGEDLEQEAENTQEVDDAPVVKFLNKMLIDAINMGASDLHFEPYEKFYRVRYRVDGILNRVLKLSLAWIFLKSASHKMGA